MSVICPICNAVSFNPHDAINHYCGRCRRFYTDPAKLYDPTCPRCRDRGKPQMYTVKGELGEYIFDIEKARRIVHREKDRPTGVVPPELIEIMLGVNEEHIPAHVDHVDPTVPGIVGQRLGGLCLIDGNHRARRCLRDGLPFHVYKLDPVESRDCLVVSDPVDFSPAMIAKEFRGILMNNPQCEVFTAVLSLTAGEDPGESEIAIRGLLTPEENARIKVEWEQPEKERPRQVGGRGGL